MSGTWAYTLLPIIKSACFPSKASSLANVSPKNFLKTLIPIASAACVVLSVGSMPKQGMFASLKFLEDNHRSTLPIT